MIRSILADRKNDDILSLERMISTDFPNINVCGKGQSITSAANLLNDLDPDLIFINTELLLSNGFELYDYFSNVDYEIIFLSDTLKHVADAINCKACGYLLKPIQPKPFHMAVNNALIKINNKKENQRNKLIADKYLKQSSNDDVIGIPTIEGFEFISINEIIRCEGLQKCTRVITREKTDIVSSYNLGEFRKILEPYGFYSPHKSHLINLNYIRKYHKEGNILMVNNSYVPVAKRKKKEFLNQVKHI
ncbi:MAG: LytTR family transcriptional regulator DNA-binding domain-containing protein [Bacteroidales bacterium]